MVCKIQYAPLECDESGVGYLRQDTGRGATVLRLKPPSGPALLPIVGEGDEYYHIIIADKCCHQCEEAIVIATNDDASDLTLKEPLMYAYRADSEVSYTVGTRNSIASLSRSVSPTTNVEEYFDVTEVSQHQEGMETAVADALAKGMTLYWPCGTYISTATIPNLHDVKHKGDGIIERDGEQWRVENRTGQTNTLFVSPTGTEDGLSPETPIGFNDALAAMKFMGPAIAGQWVLQLAAGTYPPMEEAFSALLTETDVLITGPDVSGGTPTAIVNGAGEDSALLVGVNGKVRFANLQITNTTGPAISITGADLVYIDNVQTLATTGSGISVVATPQVYVTGGSFTGGTYGVLADENSVVTVTDASFNSCQVGVRANASSVIDVSGSTFTTCPVLWEALEFSTVNFNADNTGAGTTENSRTAFSGDGTDPYQIQYHPDTGDTGRLAFGYGAWINPVASFQFSAAGTTAGFTPAGAANAFMLESSTTTNLILASSGSAANANVITFANGANNTNSITSGTSQLNLNLNGGYGVTVQQTAFRPLNDNRSSCGAASQRWNVVYATSSTISTSDERSKTEIGAIDDRVLDAWGKVEFCQFKMRDAVETKGDGARWHFGVIAQRVKAVFEEAGLDPFAYGILCYDKWDADEDQEAGDLYGIRYEEALILECAYMRRQLKGAKRK